MKYKDGLELQSLRREQDHIHRLVRRVDERLDQLAESLLSPEPRGTVTEPPASPVPPPTPPPVVMEQRPARPTVDFSAAPPVDAQPGQAQEPAAHAQPETPETKPRAEHEPRQERADSTAFEFELGRVWLVRIGIVVLLTGLVFLGNLAYQHIIPRLTAGAKLGLIVAAGGALAGIGAWLEKSRESLRNYARVLMAGGFAAIYYACYAAHFVRALQVIESAVLGGALLLAFAGGIAWFAHRRRSETLASLAILLSYYTSCINPVGGFTLFSNVLLTAAAVFFLVKNRWTKITYLSVAATYASYAYWRFFAGDSATTAAWMQVAFLACYWLLFTAAAFLTDRSAMNAPSRTSFVTANNAAFFVLAAHAISATGGGKFWVFSLAYGVVLLALSKLAAWRDPDDRTLDAAYLIQGLALTTTGLASHLTGQQLALTFAAQGTVLLSCGRARQAHLLTLGGMLSLAASFLLALFGISGIVPLPVHAVATAGITAVVLLFNAWWFKRQRGLAADRLHPVASAIATAAFILGIGWLEKIATVHATPWLVVAALGLAFVPLAEIALIAQALLPFAVAKWAGAFLPDGTPLLHVTALPVDSTILLACGIALAHWWSRARRFDSVWRKVAEWAAALSSVVVAILWLRQELHATHAMAAAAVLGIAWILAARFTRAGCLSLAGLALSVSTVADFVQFQAASHWALALLPVAHVLALGRIFRQHEASRGCIPGAAIMLLWWSWIHIPGEWLTLFYAAIAAASALLGARRREPIFSGVALVLGALATVLFWSRIELPGEWRNLAALLLFAAACRVCRRLWPADPMLAAAPAVAWSTVAGLTAWVTLHHALPSLTVAWSLLAFAFFAGGLALRDRHYRLGGLALLGLSVGRVFFVDVWSFEALWRILSFIVLGVVLLVIGYAYNRFEEKLRQWF
jgi:uncharacterized membrane protein